MVFEPNEGMPPSQNTEARVLYGAEAIYVGIRAFDAAPDSIVTRLARRDERPHSDWVDVVIDSYHDKRTAFRFGVNPAGVKNDSYMFDDTNEDDSWDAVWDVATRTDDQGWTAEFRIPYSQLRFDGAAQQTWGINFARFIARHLERSLWAPISRGDGALVSRFGDLVGLRDLSPPTRLEVLPYSLVRMESAPGSAADPFYDPSDFSSTVGADVKYGLTTDLTLDVTINPDFGQVEADPAQVNLTAFETFFPERRPFFVEGSGIFSFRFSEGDGDMASEGLFYSRRIGRPPQGRVQSSGYSDAPDRTRILGAMKLSGKTSSRLVARRPARAHGTGGGAPRQRRQRVQRPGGRATRPVRHGPGEQGLPRGQERRGDDLHVDGAATRPVAGALDLHSGAYTGGIDARHRFGDDRFIVSGYLLGSAVRGSAGGDRPHSALPGPLLPAPRCGTRRVRPDAHLTGRLGGFGDPGQDLRGLLALRDRRDGSLARLRLQRSRLHAGRRLRGRRSYGSATSTSGQPSTCSAGTSTSTRGPPTASGERPYSKGANANASFTLNNFWGGYIGVMRQSEGLSNTMLRGGPMLLRDHSWGGWYGFWSDSSRKQLQFEAGNNWQARPESGSWSYGADANVRWRPSPRATISAGPFVSWRKEDLQWVGRFGAEVPNYIFAELSQTTAGITARADWTFSPNLSLQVYAQPFVSAADYNAFKRITDSRAPAYADRFAHMGTADGGDGNLLADIDGDGAAEPLRNPDFNFKQFRSNVVLRWEYQPGSALFLVWSQGRNHYAQTGDFSFRDNLDTLLGEPGQDVFMLKLSYWLG